MSIKLTDTQLLMLSAAARRNDRCLVAAPNVKAGAAQKIAGKLIASGLVKEIKAKPGAPVWRRDDEAGQSYALKLTAAGAKAIAVDEATASESMGEQRANHPISVNPKPEPVSDPAGIDRPNSNVASTPTSPRGGTKIAQVIELLQRGDGATLAELVAATGWLPHTTRAALTGLRKGLSSTPRSERSCSCSPCGSRARADGAAASRLSKSSGACAGTRTAR